MEFDTLTQKCPTIVLLDGKKSESRDQQGYEVKIHLKDLKQKSRSLLITVTTFLDN